MLNEDLLGMKLICVLAGCGREIPPDKARYRAVTCSKEHADLYTRIKRKRVDDRECRFCHKPSTPTTRKAFKRFRRWEKDNPQLAYPNVWAVVEADGMKLEHFSQAVSQAEKLDIDFDPKLAAFEWGSIKPLPEPDALPAEIRRVLALLIVNQIAPREKIDVKPTPDESPDVLEPADSGQEPQG